MKRLARETDLSSMTVRVEGDLVELIRDRTSQVRAGYSLKRALDKISEDRHGVGQFTGAQVSAHNIYTYIYI